MAHCYIVTDIEQIVEGVPTEGYDPFYFPVEGGYLPFFFTNESFMKVLSALRNGAFLTYEDGGEQVIWDFLVNVEFPMPICVQVADCFANNAEFRQSVINSLMSDPNFVKQIREIAPGGGVPAPEGNLAGTTNPTCDLDILWAQCLAVAQETNSAITDVLEKIEVSSNAVELLDAASDFPLVGWVKQALGGDFGLSLIQYYQEAVAEQYSAQYTTTVGGVQDQIACALFCAAKGDCELTVSRIWGVMRDRLAAYVTVPTLETMGDLIDFAAGMSQDNTTVVDLAFFVAWGSAALGSFLFGEVFDTNITMLLNLAVNDANDDWMLLCVDCATPEENCFNLRLAATPLNPTGSYAVWEDTVGIKSIYYGSPYNSDYWKASISPNVLGGGIVRVEIEFEDAPPSIRFDAGSVYLGTGTIDGNKLYWEGTTGDWPITNVGTLWLFQGTGTDSAIAFPATAIQFCYEDDA